MEQRIKTIQFFVNLIRGVMVMLAINFLQTMVILEHFDVLLTVAATTLLLLYGIVGLVESTVITCQFIKSENVYRHSMWENERQRPRELLVSTAIGSVILSMSFSSALPSAMLPPMKSDYIQGYLEYSGATEKDLTRICAIPALLGGHTSENLSVDYYAIGHTSSETKSYRDYLIVCRFMLFGLLIVLSTLLTTLSQLQSLDVANKYYVEKQVKDVLTNVRKAMIHIVIDESDNAESSVEVDNNDKSNTECGGDIS